MPYKITQLDFTLLSEGKGEGKNRTAARMIEMATIHNTHTVTLESSVHTRNKCLSPDFTLSFSPDTTVFSLLISYTTMNQGIYCAGINLRESHPTSSVTQNQSYPTRVLVLGWNGTWPLKCLPISTTVQPKVLAVSSEAPSDLAPTVSTAVPLPWQARPTWGPRTSVLVFFSLKPSLQISLRLTLSPQVFVQWGSSPPPHTQPSCYSIWLLFRCVYLLAYLFIITLSPVIE